MPSPDAVLDLLNWVDWVVVVVVLLGAASGFARGFLLGTLDLAGALAALGVAVMVYVPLADRVVDLLPAPRALVLIGAFVMAALVAYALISTAVNLVMGLARPFLLALWPLNPLNQALGVVPGVVKGVLYATLLLLAFSLYPLAPQVSAAIEQSSIGSRLLTRAVAWAPRLDEVLGRDASPLTFLTPPQTDRGVNLDFGQVGPLVVDVAAEEAMLDLVNRERLSAGLAPLVMDEALREVARAHSREMFELGYFAHDSPVAGTPFDRLRKAGIRYLVAGENLAYAPDVQMAHDGLMRSPGHRANILRREFGRVGIGISRSQTRGSMFSQEFTN